MKLINENGIGLYKSSYDSRDFLMRSFLDPIRYVPPECDVSDKMTPVRSQGKGALLETALQRLMP